LFENEKCMEKDGMENYTWIKRWMIEVDGENISLVTNMHL
jgi:hypothetical protein